MDETRQLLKIFGVAATDFKAEAEKLQATADQLTSDTDKAEITKLLKDVTELCHELNGRWLETTHLDFLWWIQLARLCKYTWKRNRFHAFLN